MFSSASISSGISFVGLERTIKSTIDDEKWRLVNNICTVEETKREKLREFDSFPCFSSPSQKFITDLFMLKFNVEKDSMIRFIKSTTAHSIALDHTFKLSRFVIVPSSMGHNFSKAFAAALFILNEKGEVISFKPTVTESLKDETVIEMLHEIKQVSPEISLVMVDNCCHSRNTIKEVFENAEVKLDIWHGGERARRTVLKKNVSRANRLKFNKELSNCFKCKSDRGGKRLKETPSAEEIAKNLEKLKKSL